MADIFFDGKIYLGVKEKLLTSFKKPVRDIWIEQYPVSGQHSFKDGQEVTGLYELKYEQWCNNVATLNGKHTLVTEIKDASIIVGKCPDCYVKTFAIPSSPTKEAEADVLSKEADGDRDENTLYTYYQLDLNNMPVEWDYTICETLGQVLQQLKALDIYLDDDTPTGNGKPRSVEITGVAMTPSAYKEFLKEADID